MISLRGPSSATSTGTRLGGLLATSVLALILTVAGKLLAFGRDVALSKYFGATFATDAFFIANMIPGILWAAILVTVNVVFLPLYAQRRASGPEAGKAFVNEAVQIYLILAVFMSLVCIIGAGPIVHLTAARATPETLALARNLTIIMAVGFGFSGYVAVQNALQQSHGYYKAPLAVPVVNNAIAILGIVVASRLHDIRIAVFAAVFGWVVQAPIQRLQTRRLYGTVWGYQVTRKTLQRLALLSAPVMLGTFLDQINIYVGIYLAGGQGVGAISQLNYASRLAMFLATTSSMLISYFLFPRLAADATQGDDAQSAKTLAVGVLLVAATTAPPTLVALMMRGDLVSLVYGRGQLSGVDLAATATAFAYFALGIVFIAVREIFNRLFFSHQKMVAPLVIGIVASIVNFVASKALSAIMGTAGIALGASIAAMAYLIGQVLVTVWWKPRLVGQHLLLELFALILASLVGWFGLGLALPYLAGLPLIVRLLGGGVVFTVVFLAVLTPIVWRGGFRRLL